MCANSQVAGERQLNQRNRAMRSAIFMVEAHPRKTQNYDPRKFGAFFLKNRGDDNCFFSFYLYIKEGNLLVFLRLHCELDGWVLGVQVTQELTQGLSTMWPGGKDIIYVSDPEVGFS